jgi:transglutaminase-like putative cysteine protease
MQVKYELTLKPNAVPDGEVVRCWLPYPREDSRRQSNIKLLSVNDSNYVISPPQYHHRTIYMEKIARKDQPLKFAVEFSYQHAPEWFNLNEESIQPYNTQSELYKTYTAERPPHIVFTDSIRAVSERITGNETNPWQKVKKIFIWINNSFPWAGAREYSTIKNIPQYVLENGHGDCGQVTLLFMTLARYNGIPTRWQSGFMMQPNELNMHDWCEFYIEGIGWIPLDQSFGINTFTENENVKYFYTNGIDAYRWIVNDDFSQPLFPDKIYQRSDDVDFQRGELEWRGGNIYYDQWNWDFNVSYSSN